MEKQLTTADLRKILFETIEGLRSGEIETDDAKAIAILSGRIIDTAKMEIDYALACARIDSGKSEVSLGPVLLTAPKVPNVDK